MKNASHSGPGRSTMNVSAGGISGPLAKAGVEGEEEPSWILLNGAAHHQASIEAHSLGLAERTKVLKMA